MEFNATFLVSAISFIVFVYLMNTIFYTPVSKIIDEREKLVADTLNEANEMVNNAKQLLDEREEKLTGASVEARNFVNKSVDEFNQTCKEKIQQAKIDSTTAIDKNKNELIEQSNNSRIELDNLTNELADKIVAKVLNV